MRASSDAPWVPRRLASASVPVMAWPLTLMNAEPFALLVTQLGNVPVSDASDTE